MARQTSAGFLVFGILNIPVAMIPVCAGCLGALMNVSDQAPVMIVRGRDVGPQFQQHVEREVPHARYEAFIAAALNPCCSLLILVGALGLLLGQEWGRWLTVFSAFVLVAVFCAHDIYQLAIFRPAVNAFFDQQFPPGPEREGFKFGFSASYFFWSCFNPVIMVYLFPMCLCVLLFKSSHKVRDDWPRRRRRHRRRRRRYYDDDD